MKESPVWRCPRCRRPFANRNQEHSCGRWTVSRLFRGRPKAKRLYDAFLAAVRACGPVKAIAVQSRVGLQVRMIFAAVQPRATYVRGHLILARRVEDPRFLRVETYSPRNHLHLFELRRTEQVDARFRRLIREAYAVGRQEHLAAPRRGVQRPESNVRSGFTPPPRRGRRTPRG